MIGGLYVAIIARRVVAGLWEHKVERAATVGSSVKGPRAQHRVRQPSPRNPFLGAPAAQGNLRVFLPGTLYRASPKTISRAAGSWARRPPSLAGFHPARGQGLLGKRYSTVTLFARLRG